MNNRESTPAEHAAPVFAKRPSNVRVIGVGGCPGAGKSTLAAQLAVGLRECGASVHTVSLDTYPDWEHPHSVRWHEFAKDVDTAMFEISGQEAYIILEGFLLYHHGAVTEHCDLAFFIEISKDAARQRRVALSPEPERYFEELLWPQYLQHGRTPRGVVLLDGSQPQDVVARQALTVTQARFSPQRSSLADVHVATATPGKSVPVPGALLRPDEAGQPPLTVLVLSGAFNPIHRMHVECLVLARRHLQAQHQLNVGLAYIAPSSDDYIAAKVQQAGEDPKFAIELKERCRLSQLAIEAAGCEDWVRVLPWGLMNGSSIAASIEATVGSVRPVGRCLTVYGADFYLRCGGLGPRTVCVARCGYEDELEKLIHQQSSGGPEPLPLEFYCTLEKLEPASSTSVREFWKDGDWEGLQQSNLLHPSVLLALRGLGGSPGGAIAGEAACARCVCF